MKTKKALIMSCVSLILCVSILIGSTWAWFTDSVRSGNNVITTGNLDVELEYSENGVYWNPVKDSTKIFDDTILWEPGHTEVAYLRVSNVGDLALKYQLGVKVASEIGSVNTLGEPFALSDYIEFGVVENVTAAFASRGEARAAVTEGTPIASGYSDGKALEAGAEADCVALVVYMPESVGNEANAQIGSPVPTISLTVDLFATQYTSESDSFGSDYDAGATMPKADLNVSFTAAVDVEDGMVSAPATIGRESSGITAQIPEGVAVADGVTQLTLSVETLENSEANIELERGETMTSLDIHIEGVAEDNTVPMLITLEEYLPKNLNTTSVAMYHVEDGNTVPMTLTATPTAHNEFSYDPATGTVVLCVASFSEYTTVVDNKNLWEGGFDYSWYEDKTSPYTISSADQLAGFGVIVDDGYTKPDGTYVEADTFEGETVILDADINLGGTVSFNPIGCGYVNGVANSNKVEGRAFMGVFDGQGHTISGLYQNGWDLGLSYCTLGGGLFASVCNATIQNLTISGANIVMECVEMGVVAGLSQGNCTYENINIYGCKIANYQRATGGLIGEVSAYNGGGTTTIKNVNIDSATVVGTLWGDFDAPVGGVIGARWDDDNSTKVVMENVNVACRLDVYNDITSTYQWHAYRRAGMLIGNTDTPPANGKDAQTATADFLTCSDVSVYYGDWVNYHYCEFNNHNSSWPFVRVEAGENCEAYSNPRWGVPNDPVTGQPITSLEHNHIEGDEHYVEKPFNQLYGGGQGVYGQPAHDGVTIETYAYAITYINNGKVLHTNYVKDNSVAVSTENSAAAAAAVADMGEGYEFSHWMNAGSTKVESVAVNNTENIVLYPSFKDRYTVTYVDNDGEILHWEVISEGTKTTKITPEVPQIEGGYTGVWSMTDFSKITSDVTVYPVYNAEDGIVKLEPVDNEPKDGIIDHYNVASVEENDANINIVIPSTFNGKPVLGINGSAFAEFDNITTVTIPISVTSIGADAFANKENSGFLGALKYEQITFLYEGTYAQWQAIEKDANWDRYVGQGSKIYFLADSTYIEETARNGTWGATDRVWSDPKEGTYSAG